MLKRFENTTLPHLASVYAMAKRLCGNAAEADDLVQEVYLRALNGFRTFDLREFGAKPWLLKILYNVFYSNESRRRRQPTFLDDVDLDGITDELDLPPNSTAGFSGVQWDAVDDELKSAVDRLPPEYAAVLLMWAVEDMSYREIAEVCTCPIGTVMSRLYRARQTLTRELAGYGRRSDSVARSTS